MAAFVAMFGTMGLTASAQMKDVLVSPATSNNVKFERRFEQVFAPSSLHDAFKNHPAFNAVFENERLGEDHAAFNGVFEDEWPRQFSRFAASWCTLERILVVRTRGKNC